MKRIILLALLVVAGTMIIWSQVPQAMNYKAIAKDDWGVSLPNKTITLRFSILKDSETGSIVYQETHRTTTNKFGLMDVEIGKGVPGISSFDMIDWSTGIYYIKIEMDPNGGTNFRLEDPAHQLLSVPYALFAESSGNTNFIEADPFFVSSPSSGIWSSDIFNWNTAFGWGNHANEGYLKSFTESDPLFLLHPAHGITSENINNWNTTFGWGNHADAGYLKSFTELDPVFIAHPVFNIASENISNWNTAFSWGNHEGLYRPLSYVPAWSEIIDKPSFATVATSGSYNDLADKPTIDGSETIVSAGNNVTVTGEGTAGDPYVINSAAGGSTIPGVNPGDMMYWNGSAWVIVPIGSEGQVLTIMDGIPTWAGNSIVVDIEGITYNTIQIGSQTWMAENLMTTKYNDGTSIPLITDDVAWSELTTPAYCWYLNDEPMYGNTYGALYNWYTISTTTNGGKNICPTGWHVPSDAEWTNLTDYLGGEDVAGGKLKETGTAHWISPNTGATNKYGFTAVPGGDRLHSNGIFYSLGGHGHWWSSSEFYETCAWSRTMDFNTSYVNRTYDHESNGFSVRCVKD